MPSDRDPDPKLEGSRALPDPAPADRPERSSASRRILVVDDNADHRFVISAAMQDAGYRTETAADGYEALERARARPPDVVLLDLMMPRMDGWDTIRLLRELPGARAPVVIAVTARTDPGLEERLRASGFSGYLSKPFTLRRLTRMVEGALAMEAGRERGQEWIDLPPDAFGLS